jgi:TolA-binding protein
VALLWLTEGEVLRHEAEIDRRGGHSFEVPLKRLREAVRRFEKLEREIKDVSLTPQRREGSPESLTEDELHSLGIHLRLQLARVYRNRAECYSPDSDDRVDAATQALRVLGDMLAQTASDNTMSWEGRIEQLVCYRLLESADEAERLLQVFRKPQLPKSLKGRIHAEAARAALVFASPEEALRWVKLSLVPSDPGAADLDLARLEAFTKSWQMVTPDDQTLQSSWRQRTLSLAKYIAQSHGRYWARRADRLLLQQVQGTAQAGDVEILRRQADDLYLQGKWEASVNMYDQAAAAAEQGGFTDELFLCRYRAGLVQVKRSEDHDAMMRLQQVSRAFVDHAEAAPAHFAAIQAAIRLARQDPAALERYEQLLSEHVRHWPDSDGASRAYLWLARLRGHRGDWPGAIELYQHIAPTSRESLPAINGLEASWRGRLKELQSQQETNQHDIMPELDNAVRSFQALAAKSGVSSEGVAASPASKKLAVLAASRLLLEFAPSRAGEAEWMLTQVLSGTEEDDAHAWREDAQAWLFLARALQPEKREAADQLLRELDEEASAVAGGLRMRRGCQLRRELLFCP